MKDLFFPISKKVMFRNYRFVTAENILKCYHRVYISMITWYIIPVTNCSCADPEGGGGGAGGPDPLENYKNTGSLSNTGPDSLKITKLPIRHLMMGHHRPASKTSF